MALCAEGKVRVAATRALPVAGLRSELLGAAVASGRAALEAGRVAGKVVGAATRALPVTGTALVLAAAGVAGRPLLLLELAAVVAVPVVRLALVVLERVVLLAAVLLLSLLLVLTLQIHTQTHEERASAAAASQRHPRIEIKSKNHVIIALDLPFHQFLCF